MRVGPAMRKRDSESQRMRKRRRVWLKRPSGGRREKDIAEAREDRIEEERLLRERERRLQRRMTIWVGAEWIR